jgi:hypothetical protein
MSMELGVFFLEDYKLKIEYLTNHFGRMWNRFNFFVGIQTAILAAFVVVLGREEGAGGALLVALFALLMAIVWWIAGSEDRYLVDHYRSLVEQAAGRLTDPEQGGLDPAPEDYTYVGYVPDKLLDFRSPVEWRLRVFSTTRLAGLVPLMAAVIWLLVILVWGFSKLIEMSTCCLGV